jgi:hypothetical protein
MSAMQLFMASKRGGSPASTPGDSLARSTVHAPQSPSAQTILVPGNPRALRSQSASIVKASRPRT